MYSFSFFVVQDQGCKEKSTKKEEKEKQVSSRQLLTFELFYLFFVLLVCVCVCFFFLPSSYVAPCEEKEAALTQIFLASLGKQALGT